MASATGIPERNPALSEEEPLLGRAGDASQEVGKPLPYNLVLGTAVLAQAGALVLTAAVWGVIFSHPLLLFSAHPVLNSVGILLLAQGALILQPTHTSEQKRQGTLAHATINNVAFLLLISGLVIIEVHKRNNGIGHFESPHAIMGVISYVLIILQTAVGITQYFIPQVYGGVGNAKKLYKYHRAAGYAIFVFLLATVAAATQTRYNKLVLHLNLWVVVLLAILILAGIVPRIRKAKFGL